MCFFNATSTTELYTLSLHDALPISGSSRGEDTADARFTVAEDLVLCVVGKDAGKPRHRAQDRRDPGRSEEHTSELQSLAYLVCRLLLEKKKFAAPAVSPARVSAKLV